ncbi:MAG: hypothetical protein ACKOBL_19725 [Chloroflexota bacterium]
MQNEFKEDAPTPSVKSNGQKPASTSNRPSIFTRLINSLLNMGLGEPLIKLGVNLFSVIAIVLVVFLSRNFYRQAQDMPEVKTKPQVQKLKRQGLSRFQNLISPSPMASIVQLNCIRPSQAVLATKYPPM